MSETGKHVYTLSIKLLLRSSESLNGNSTPTYDRLYKGQAIRPHSHTNHTLHPVL
jgi:hypothetical protein